MVVVVGGRGEVVVYDVVHDVCGCVWVGGRVGVGGRGGGQEWLGIPSVRKHPSATNMGSPKTCATAWWVEWR